MQGTLSAEQLANSAALIPDSSLERNDMTQRFFFGLIFTCNGYVTKWTVGAEYIGGPVPAQLQVWRKVNGTLDTYNKVQVFDLDTPSATIGDNLYEFFLPSPVPVREGDILGLFNPCLNTRGRSNPCTNDDVASWIVYYQRNAGIVNHQLSRHVTSPDSVTSITNSELEVVQGTEIPLVLPESKFLVVHSEMHFKAYLQISLSPVVVDITGMVNFSYSSTSTYPS